MQLPSATAAATSGILGTSRPAPRMALASSIVAKTTMAIANGMKSSLMKMRLEMSIAPSTTPKSTAKARLRPLRALIASIPHNERFGTLETDYELLTHLQASRRNMLALQARVGLGEVTDGRHVGEFSVAELIPEALRQNLARLVIGEVRGAEAGAMFEAMQSGA